MAWMESFEIVLFLRIWHSNNSMLYLLACDIIIYLIVIFD